VNGTCGRRMNFHFQPFAFRAAQSAVHRAWWTALGLTTVLGLSACSGMTWLPSPPPTATPLPPTATLTVTLTSTPTHTLTITPTRTLVPTVTPRPTLTPTITLTLMPTFTLTPTETASPSRPAVLYPRRDVNGKLLDWRYTHITEYTLTEKRLPRVMWAYLGFQLMDRAIHRDTLKIMDKDVTVYYLNVQHDFDKQPRPMRLVLGGIYGKDLPISQIPAGGSGYIRLRVLAPGETFDPYIFHRDANKGYPTREVKYPDMLLADFERLLPGLPDEIIVLADSQVLFDPDERAIVQEEMSRVAFLAARYLPFTHLDEFNRFTGPSPAASSLSELLLHGVTIAGGIPAYSSDTLVLLPHQTGRVP
jgi:hypothetical protein